MKKRVAFIIPGHTDSPNYPRYKKIAKLFNKKGIKTIPVHITWKHKVISDYIKQFRIIFHKNKGQENYFFGFSFGALIAFILSTELKPKIIFLCSLSPYFLEDLKKFPKSWKRGDKRRISDAKNFQFNKIAPKIKSKTYLFYGEKEPKLVVIRSKETNKKIKKSTLKAIRNTGHYLSERYIEKIGKAVNKI